MDRYHQMAMLQITYGPPVELDAVLLDRSLLRGVSRSTSSIPGLKLFVRLIPLVIAKVVDLELPDQSLYIWREPDGRSFGYGYRLQSGSRKVFTQMLAC